MKTLHLLFSLLPPYLQILLQPNLVLDQYPQRRQPEHRSRTHASSKKPPVNVMRSSVRRHEGSSLSRGPPHHLPFARFHNDEPRNGLALCKITIGVSTAAGSQSQTNTVCLCRHEHGMWRRSSRLVRHWICRRGLSIRQPQKHCAGISRMLG